MNRASPIPASKLAAPYWTTNGFCVYLQHEDNVHAQKEACSLRALARSVLDQHTYSNYTTLFRSKCLEQVDWPYMHTMLFRDNTTGTNARVNDSQPCAVLDRMPRIQYRIKLDAPFSASAQRTTGPAGACHMGRPVTVREDLAGDCWPVNSSSDTFFYCENSKTYRTLSRRRILTPHETVRTNRDRRVCRKRTATERQCDPPPAFSTSTAAELPIPEVGYGSLFRWEMARAMAGDLRSVLCGNAQDCSSSSVVLNASSWTLQSFLHDFFNDPSRLLLSPEPLPQQQQQARSLRDIINASSTSTRPAYDDSLWNQPWVYCNDTNCTGTISKRDWVDDRGRQCKDKVVDHLRENPGDGAIRLDLCNLNSQMDLLCRRLVDSVRSVANANCLAAGLSQPACLFSLERVLSQWVNFACVCVVVL